MAIKKFRFRPEGVNDYSDILHPETSADVVLLKDTAGNFSSNNVEGALAEIYSQHVNKKNNPHAVTAAQVGAAPASHVGSGGSAHAVATTATAGFMSASDKLKLNEITLSNLITKSGSDLESVRGLPVEFFKFPSSINFGSMSPNRGADIVGTELWVANSGSPKGALRFDLATGVYLGVTTIADPAGDGFANDGSYYWFRSSNDGSLLRYNKSNNVLSLTVESGERYTRGITVDNNYVYTTYDGKLWRFTKTSSPTKTEYALPSGRWVTGAILDMAYQDGSIWVLTTVGVFRMSTTGLLQDEIVINLPSSFPDTRRLVVTSSYIYVVVIPRGWIKILRTGNVPVI